jgi:ketosteroid isomerase-like protein
VHIRIFATALTLTTLTTVVCRADDSKGVRKELDAGYARMCQGIKHKDVKPMAELSTPDFTMEEAGRTENAKAALAELEQSFKTMQPIDSAMTIRTLKISKDRAVATVDYSMSFTMKDAQGKTHQMSGKGVTEDTWIKTKSGWRIKKVKTLKADETMDGKTAKR